MSTAGGVLMVVGAAWAVVAALGVLRFDDALGRMQAATKTTTLALLLTAAGAALSLGGAAAVKLGLVVLLVLVTAPVGGHLIGRAVHRRPGRNRIRIDTVDELRTPPTARTAARARRAVPGRASGPVAPPAAGVDRGPRPGAPGSSGSPG